RVGCEVERPASGVPVAGPVSATTVRVGGEPVRRMTVVGVRVELPSNQPVVLLKETEGNRYLPIWIGTVEAAAIAYQQQEVQLSRPLTHDLLRDVLGALEVSLTSVEITELRETVYYAELVLDGR